MLGRKTLAADHVYGAAPVAFTAATSVGGVGLMEISCSVEETEMLVDLELRACVSQDVSSALDFTYFVDGADVETVGTNGLYRAVIGTTAVSVYFNHTLRLAKGQHLIQLRLKSAQTPTIAGATIPAELTVRRHSHPATLGHGVDSKVQLIQ